MASGTLGGETALKDFTPAGRIVPGVQSQPVLYEDHAARDMPSGQRGQRVFAMLPSGGYAEAVIADVNALMPLPENLGAGDAVAIGTNALVAQFALDRGRAASGERILVRGATGGIGVVAVQLAALRGGEVVATQRRDFGQTLRVLGAAEVVDADAAGAGDFDVVVDLVAGAGVASFLRRLRPNGRYVLAGVAAGMPASDFAAPLIGGFRKSLSLATFSLDTVPRSEVQAAARHLFEATATGRLSPAIAATLPLEEAARAHEMLCAGGVFGKIVLRTAA